SPCTDSPLNEAREPKGRTVPLMAGLPPQTNLSASSSKIAAKFFESPQELEIRTTLVPDGEIKLTVISEIKECVISKFTFTSAMGKSSRKVILDVMVDVPTLEISLGRSPAALFVQSNGVVVKLKGVPKAPSEQLFLGFTLQ